MNDPYKNVPDHILASPSAGFEITPSDDNDLPTPIRCINVAETGVVVAELIGGDVLPFTVAAGIQFPMRARKILATGTTATGLVGSL